MFSALINSIALSDKDDAWRNIFHKSAIGRLWSHLICLRTNIQSVSLKRFASTLQVLSFLVILLLCASLGLPQFTNDKEALALISLAAFSLWFLGYLMGGKENRETTALDMVVVLLLGANLIAAAASHYFKPSLIGLAKMLVYTCSYFSFAAILGRSTKRQIAVVIVLVFTGLLVSLYGLYQYKIGVAPLATWEDPTIVQQGVRIYSTLGNPNLLAGYLVPLAPLAFALAVMAFSLRRWLSGVVTLASSGVIAAAIVLTGSRGGWLGLFVSMAMMIWLTGCYVWINWPRLRYALIIAVALLAMAIAMALHFVPTFEQRLHSMFVGYEHSSNAFRFNVWSSSFKIFLDSWWFGVGPGNQTFILAYGLYMKSGYDALGAYCVPLEVAVETGVIGLFFFFVLVVSSIARAHWPFWHGESNLKRWLAAGAAAAVVGLMAHGLVDTVFYRPQVQFIFWLMLALLSMNNKQSERSDYVSQCHVSEAAKRT